MALGTSGLNVYQLSADPGKIVASWKQETREALVIDCQPSGPSSAVVLREKTVELWDLRAANVVAQRLDGPVAFSSFGRCAIASDQCHLPTSVISGVMGGLYQVDWRT